MKIVDVRVISTSGANKRPYSGDVTFDDGKFYGFMWHPINNHWTLFLSYKVGGGMWVRRMFRSAKREAALDAHFA